MRIKMPAVRIAQGKFKNFKLSFIHSGPFRHLHLLISLFVGPCRSSVVL